MTIATRTSSLAFLMVFAFALSIAVLPHGARAATTCSFSGNLELGSDSESVRCLQQYLNANGYPVAATGVGSQGHETTQYKEKTQAAVKKWQQANGITPTGTFGPLSQAKYLALMLLASTPAPTPAPAPAPVPVPVVTDQNMESARSAILSAKDSHDDATDTYDDAKEDGDELGSSKSYIAEGYSRLTEALFSFVDKSYGDALSKAKSAKEYFEDALDEIDGSGSSSDKKKAQNALDDADDAITDAKHAINESKKSNVEKAESYLEDAKDEYEDAEDAFDDGDYDDAIESAEKAQEYAEKAEDAA